MMNFFLDENSTRTTIILLLKKSGGMSIDELSKMIDITPMGIRQHLLALEKKGMVTYISRRRGIGRPGFIYMLTDAANSLFPNTYDSLALGILRDIRQNNGTEKIHEIFNWRRERLLKSQKESLAGVVGTEAKLNALKAMLEKEGHIVELRSNGNHFHFIKYHCPIQKIAAEFKEACQTELELYKELIDKDIVREQAISESAPACHYLVPKN